MRANQLRLWFASMAYVLLWRCAARACSHPVRPSHLRHHPAEAAEDRRLGARQRTAGEDRDGLRLSLAAGVRARSRLAGQRRPVTRTSKARHSPKTTSPHAMKAALGHKCAPAAAARQQAPVARSESFRPLREPGREKSGINGGQTRAVPGGRDGRAKNADKLAKRRELRRGRIRSPAPPPVNPAAPRPDPAPGQPLPAPI